MKMSKLLIAAVILILAAAAMSLPVLGAAFTDRAQIADPYLPAVDAMSSRGILNGFPEGDFQPLSTLTREQGAKIVTCIVLGDEVNSLTTAAAPFEDVESDRWSAPCIAWAAEKQILLGYGNGKFGPADTLTADQFAKMLLCALGLAREGNYVGAGDSWTGYVREDAKAAGLYAGDPGMETDAPISREQAALMAFNAMEAAMNRPTPIPGEGQTGSGESGSGQTGTGQTGAPEAPVNPENPAPANPGTEEQPDPDADDSDAGEQSGTDTPGTDTPGTGDEPGTGEGSDIETPVIDIGDGSGTEQPGTSEEPEKPMPGGNTTPDGDIILPEIP